MDLKDIDTWDLIRELETREGIEKNWAEPDEILEISVTSTALVLIITD